MTRDKPIQTPSEVHEPELDPPFDVIEPKVLSSPLVFSSPHSGSVYPQSFLRLSRLNAVALRRSEDAFVDDLFAGARKCGAPLIRARFPRAYLDLNREPYELDPRMFEGRLPDYANTRFVRVAGGLGTIAKVVGESQEIYAGRIPVEEALHRITCLYKPYHACLRSLLERAYDKFGIALLIDCHSMPSSPAGTTTSDKRLRTDFVVGDRFGTSSAPAFVEALELAMRDRGFAVARNKPYAGGHITEHYGAPHNGVHAIQVEINRAIYMDERNMEKSERFAKLETDMTAIVAALSEIPWRATDWTGAPQPSDPPEPSPTRKEPLAKVTSGPSQGRKRPRRASAATIATAPQQHARAAQKAQGCGSRLLVSDA